MPETNGKHGNEKTAEIGPAAHTDARKKGGELAHRYTDAEKKRALAQVALEGGNCRRAATALKQQDFPVPARTLQAWKKREPELYREAVQEVIPLVNAEIADKLTKGIRLDLQNHEKGARQLAKEIGDPDAMKPSERAKAVKDSKVSAAVGIDKRALVTNQPTDIRRHVSVAESLRELQRLGAIVGTAEDVTDAEVVQSDQLPEGHQDA
jgi:hypothetical protein